MARTRAQGVIVVRFPPPVPTDFGRALKATILERLGKGHECSASNTGAAGGPPGWALDIRVKNPRDTRTSAIAVADCLAPMAATMEVSERRGPVEIPLPGGWDAGLGFPDGTDAWADLYLTLPRAFGERDAVLTAVGDAVAPHGAVTHAAKLSTLNLTVRVGDARNATACVEKLTGWLSGAEAKLTACTESRPLVTPIGGG